MKVKTLKTLAFQEDLDPRLVIGGENSQVLVPFPPRQKGTAQLKEGVKPIPKELLSQGEGSCPRLKR